MPPAVMAPYQAQECDMKIAKINSEAMQRKIIHPLTKAS